MDKSEFGANRMAQRAESNELHLNPGVKRYALCTMPSAIQSLQ
jgi:hypothetical protein